MSSFSIKFVPGKSDLFITYISGISIIPAFIVWIASPIKGVIINKTVSTTLAIAISTCPTPTDSTKITSFPIASSTLIDF